MEGRIFKGWFEDAQSWLKDNNLSNIHNGLFYLKQLSKEGSKGLKDGYAIDQSTKTIYVSPSFLERIKNPQAKFDFIIRKIIFMSFLDQNLGREHEYEYAYKMNPTEVKNLFPADSDPKTLINEITAGLLFKEKSETSDPQGFYTGLATEAVGDGNKHLGALQYVPLAEIAKTDIQGKLKQESVIIGANDSAREANLILLERAKNNLYLMGVNALDGMAELLKRA